MPAQAGIHVRSSPAESGWIPAFAGMTGEDDRRAESRRDGRSPPSFTPVAPLGLHPQRIGSARAGRSPFRPSKRDGSFPRRRRESRGHSVRVRKPLDPRVREEDGEVGGVGCSLSTGGSSSPATVAAGAALYPTGSSAWMGALHTGGESKTRYGSGGLRSARKNESTSLAHQRFALAAAGDDRPPVPSFPRRRESRGHSVRVRKPLDPRVREEDGEVGGVGCSLSTGGSSSPATVAA